jgi:hypothetical protein
VTDLKAVVLRVSVSLLLFLALVSLFSRGVYFVHGTFSTDASSDVEEADVAVRQAFNATLGAERAGANVSNLILMLNEAGDALGNAENALRDGDAGAAAGNASLCIGIANNVSTNADVLKASALGEAHSVFWDSVAFSVVGMTVFTVVLALVWAWFKRKCAGRALGLKPEVTG